MSKKTNLLKSLTFAFASLSILLSPNVALAEDELAKHEGKKGFYDLSLEELLDIPLQLKDKLLLYGYLGTHAEIVFNTPKLDSNGKTIYVNDPLEYSIPNFNIFATSKIKDSIDVLINVSKDNETFEIRNVWGNIKFYDLLQLRLGKMYRRFDLYNEKLDQLPAIMGIETPEIFDKDHLMVTRTTNVMLHGEKKFDIGNWSYALSTDNGEGGANAGVIPFGWDTRIKLDTEFEPLGNPSVTFGTSGYLSSIGSGSDTSSVKLDSGSPNGGILPWMNSDKFVLFGGFMEAELFYNLVIQAAYWQSNHDAKRNPTSILEVVKKAELIPAQRKRFLGNNASKSNNDLLESDVITEAKYSVQTFYVRAGYTFNTSCGSFTPYGMIDWMYYPEAIKNKTYGGDSEAGFADDGDFLKPSLGLIYKPFDELAFKLDTSTHIQTFNGKTEIYPEIRGDISFAFK